VPRLCIKLYPDIRLTTEENHGKTSVGVAEKRLTEDCWELFVWSTWWPFHGRPRPVCWPSPPLACASGDLGQPSVRYLPSCRTKGFPASANFESKLSVRALKTNCKTLNAFLSPVHATCHHDCPPAAKPASTPRRLFKLGQILSAYSYAPLCPVCLSWLLRSRVWKFRRDL
jgi:hypothetical protein